MGPVVNVICRNYRDDRVIPRFSRYLRDFLGWQLTAGPVRGADLYYLTAYFEIQRVKHYQGLKLASYFTHREEDPPGNRKAALFDQVGKIVDLRIVTADKYSAHLLPFGDTVKFTPPVERNFFTIPKKAKNRKIVAGFSGFTYPNKRKGEKIAKKLIGSPLGSKLSWVASGRGWPVKTRRYPWAELPRFFQSLDILVITATVEGVPMPPLEALSCGVSVVIPRDVGLLDELPDLDGIYRYPKGSANGALKALELAVARRSSVDRHALREVTSPFSITAWCEQHKSAFEELLES